MPRRWFTHDEAGGIRAILTDLRKAERTQQKALRTTLRREYGFYITAFVTDRAGMTCSDFDDLVERGVIRLVGDSKTGSRSPRWRTSISGRAKEA